MNSATATITASASVLALLASNVVLAPAAAASGDPLESVECRRALAVVDSEEAAVAEASRASGGVTANDRRLIDAKLAPARRRAASACLARQADASTLPAQRPVRPPPVATAPMAVAPAARPALAAALPPTAPLAPTIPRAGSPYAVTSCDAGGCWANDGSRLNRVGATLWGPRGACSVQGSMLQCP